MTVGRIFPLILHWIFNAVMFDRLKIGHDFQLEMVVVAYSFQFITNSSELSPFPYLA